MYSICNVFGLGFWWTAGSLFCLLLVGTMAAFVMAAFTSWNYKKYMKGRREKNV